MPEPGDPYPGFYRGARALLAERLQFAAPGDTLPRGAGLDRSLALPRGDRWWIVWACPDHLEGLTGLRQFGVWRR